MKTLIHIKRTECQDLVDTFFLRCQTISFNVRICNNVHAIACSTLDNYFHNIYKLLQQKTKLINLRFPRFANLGHGITVSSGCCFKLSKCVPRSLEQSAYRVALSGYREPKSCLTSQRFPSKPGCKEPQVRRIEPASRRLFACTN
jgi:hypothetical protein